MSTTPLVGHHRAFDDPLRDDLVLDFSDKIRDADQLDLFGDQTYYFNAPRFSVPLRAINSVKYQFARHDILPHACGTMLGTALLLRYVSDHILNEEHFAVITLDYDLYWRVFKFFYTSSLIDSFPELKKRMILILAPWHVFKHLAEVVWGFMAPLLFARLWLTAFKTTVPNSPDLKDIMFFFVAISLSTRRHLVWRHDSVIGLCLNVLIYRLIPLVS